MPDSKKNLIVIDGNIIIHRAYHALPPLRMKKGELGNAVYGFLLVFFRAIKNFKPNYIAIAFDTNKPTFRHKEFKGYKQKRPPTPKDLSSQIPKIKEVLQSFGINIFEKEGFEADDIIGTVSHLVSQKCDLSLDRQLIPVKQLENKSFIETIILSGDLDVLQLINENTKVCTLRRGLKDIMLYNEKEVQNRYNLNVNQLVDFRALKGDPSDNIPGVTGIGEKTAIYLLQEFGTLENIYNEITKKSDKVVKAIKKPVLDKLIKDKEQAFFSKKLSIIKTDVPISFDLEECSFNNYDRERAVFSLEQIGFRSLINKLPNNCT